MSKWIELDVSKLGNFLTESMVDEAEKIKVDKEKEKLKFIFGYVYVYFFKESRKLYR